MEKMRFYIKLATNGKIWVEGEKSFECNLYKPPSHGTVYSVKELGIAEVKGEGAILIMTDGTIYEVDSIYTINTRMWLGFNDALIIDDYELINLDESDVIIHITRIK